MVSYSLPKVPVDPSTVTATLTRCLTVVITPTLPGKLALLLSLYYITFSLHWNVESHCPQTAPPAPRERPGPHISEMLVLPSLMCIFKSCWREYLLGSLGDITGGCWVSRSHMISLPRHSYLLKWFYYFLYGFLKNFWHLSPVSMGSCGGWVSKLSNNQQHSQLLQPACGVLDCW